MSIITSTARHWFARHPKCREWAWFVALWCAGLGVTMACAYPIKWLTKQL